MCKSKKSLLKINMEYVYIYKERVVNVLKNEYNFKTTQKKSKYSI